MKPDTILDLIDQNNVDTKNLVKCSIYLNFKSLIKVHGYKYFLNKIEFYQSIDKDFIEEMEAKLIELGWETELKRIDIDAWSLFIEIPQGK